MFKMLTGLKLCFVIQPLVKAALRGHKQSNQRITLSELKIEHGRRISVASETKSHIWQDVTYKNLILKMFRTNI